jgi:hypothetical protein
MIFGLTLVSRLIPFDLSCGTGHTLDVASGQETWRTLAW